MTKCTICQDPEQGVRMTCSMGSICMKCSDSLTSAELQSISRYHSAIWVLAEVFFRRGAGEDVTFKEVWESSPYLSKLITIEDMMPKEIVEELKKNADKKKC